jgi:HEAT repeat protein
VSKRALDPDVRLLQAYGERDVDHLISALKDPVLRRMAARYLRRLGAREAIPHLLRMLEANDPVARASAARSLGALGATEGADRLATIATDDRVPAVRTWAMYAVGQLHDFRFTSLLTSALADEDPMIRRSAVSALVQLGNPDAIPALEAAARREGWLHRGRFRRAIRSLRGR